MLEEAAEATAVAESPRHRHQADPETPREHVVCGEPRLGLPGGQEVQELKIVALGFVVEF